MADSSPMVAPSGSAGHHPIVYSATMTAGLVAENRAGSRGAGGGDREAATVAGASVQDTLGCGTLRCYVTRRWRGVAAGILSLAAPEDSLRGRTLEDHLADERRI